MSLLSQHPDAHPNLSGNSIHLSDSEVIFDSSVALQDVGKDMGRFPYVSMVMYQDSSREAYQLPIDAAFIAIGHDPNTRLFRGQARDITSAAETDQFVEEIPSGYVKIAIENGHL